jgi:hypothetical protein
MAKLKSEEGISTYPGSIVEIVKLRLLPGEKSLACIPH